MENRISTRRCNHSKTPCQQIHNPFITKNNQLFNLIPFNVYKLIPNTHKLSCQTILKIKQFTPPHTKQQSLQQIRANAQVQCNEIMKLVSQQIQPNNVQQQQEQEQRVRIDDDIKIYETQIKKVLKRDLQTKQTRQTRSISDYDPTQIKHDNYFADEKIIQRLQDYLCID